MGCNNSKGLPMNIDGSATEAPDGAAKKETASQITESKLEIAMKTKRRAQNVFAEHIDLSGSFQSARFPKSPYVKGTIRQALMSNFVFSTLTPSEMEEFVDYMKQEKFEGGSDVIKQGEPGDYFYVVESGSFTYFVDGKPVGKAHPGNSFGELALMYNSPRAATVRADSDSVVWSLNRMTFRTILANATNNDSQKVKNSLRKVELLKDLEDAQLESLAGAVQMVTYAPGDVIIKKGDTGNIFYMIKSGTVKCTDMGSNTKDQKISMGDYFGEKALLTGDVRAANVVAETAVTVMALDRIDFNSILGPMNDVLTNNLNLRVLKGIPILSNLTHSEVMSVANMLRIINVRKGGVIISQGDIGESLYIVKSGECTATKDGVAKALKTFRNGEFFGEMALLNKEPRVCNVIATEDTELYQLDKAGFNRILGSLSDIMKRTVDKRTKANQTADSSVRDIPMSSLTEISFLGSGTFGQVSLMQDKKTKEVFALKKMSKAQIVAHQQQDNVMSEKAIMVLCNSPFILKLINTYKDSKSLYFLMEFCQGGELFTVLHTDKSDGVPEKNAKFYACCVLLGLQHMASKEIAYRDLKPENAMVDSTGYCKIIDMGFAKVVKHKTYTLCGTPEYLAPEIVLGRGHNRGVDHWAFGILCYEMIAGYSPFADLEGMDQVIICQNIVKGKLAFPKGFPTACKDLIKKLLVRDPVNRMGMTKGGVETICAQPWFKDVKWDNYINHTEEAPWKPVCKDILDTSNFDPYEQEEYHDPNYKDVGDWDKDF